MALEDDELVNWFSFHPPQADAGERYDRLRAGALAYARLIKELCPPGADRTAAFRKLREVSFTAVASIACTGPIEWPKLEPPPPPEPNEAP